MALLVRFNMMLVAVLFQVVVFGLEATESETHQFGADAPVEVVAQPFITAADTQFGGSIEAAAVDKYGSIFATDFIGLTCSLGQACGGNEIQQQLFFNDSSCSSFFNGLRFLPPSTSSSDKATVRALAADVKGHRVVKLSKNEWGGVTSSVFCEDSGMVQPNDIAIATRAGRVYTSGQSFTSDTVVGDGDLWMCESPSFALVGGQSVKAKRLGVFGRTNGIEISPDEKTLYLSEAFNKNNDVVSNKVWRFSINEDTGDVWGKTLFVDFEQLDGSQAVDVDGMRTDTEGNLFVTRNGGGEVVKFSPEGQVLVRIKLSGTTRPTNLELGGTYGTSLFVVGECAEATPSDKGCVDVWHGNWAPGRAFTELNAAS